MEDLLDACTEIATADLLVAVEAVIEARPDVDPSALERFSQRLSRRADKLERERRGCQSISG